MARSSSLLALGCALTAVPIAALAAPAVTNYYIPPKLISRGKNTTAVAGAGTVIVQVLVNKDGTFKVQKILKSTNPADNAAALEIAQTSKYKPATKGDKPQLAFYSFTLKFTTSGVAAAPEDVSELGTFERMLTAGNYSGARTKLDAYLQAHPGDSRALVDSGVANYYLNEFIVSATAFDKAGSIPQNYQPVAARAYGEASIAAINVKDFKNGLAFGKRATAMAPGYGSFSALGIAEYASGDFAAATADLERARTFAGAEKPSVKNQIATDSFLISTYLAADAPEKARQIAAEVKKLDPQSTAGETPFINFYVKQAVDKETAAKFGEAAAAYEQAAEAVPSSAAQFWGRAALLYLRGEKPDTAKAKADAQKALNVDPANALANFAQGIALANDGKKADALVYLQKADDAAKKSNDAQLTAAIETQIKRLNGTK